MDIKSFDKNRSLKFFKDALRAFLNLLNCYMKYFYYLNLRSLCNLDSSSCRGLGTLAFSSCTQLMERNNLVKTFWAKKCGKFLVGSQAKFW